METWLWSGRVAASAARISYGLRRIVLLVASNLIEDWISGLELLEFPIPS